MEAFLSSSSCNFKSGTYNTLTLVLGNESCDLDSAVCSVVFASFLNWQHLQIKQSCCTKVYRNTDSVYSLFVPVLNVPKQDYEVKTEVAFAFKEAGLDSSHFVFRDEIDIKQLLNTKDKNLNATLVDHHILAANDAILSPHVTEIIDHRVKNTDKWIFKKDVRETIEIVGSCATLVCDRIRNVKDGDFFREIPTAAQLLYGTIILDTVNFSKDIDKATPKDKEIIDYLEKILNIEDKINERENTLKKFVNARKDVSKLSPEQLLRKDTKIIGKIIVPSLPILVQEFLSKPNVQEALESVVMNNECDVIVLLGMNLASDQVMRDLAIFSMDGAKQLADKLATFLEKCDSPDLQLSCQNPQLSSCKLYKQLNLAASRKQVMPAIQVFLNN